MILCELDAPEGHPGKVAYTCMLSYPITSFTSVSVFSVCCYSSVSISVAQINFGYLTPCLTYGDLEGRNPSRGVS